MSKIKTNASMASFIDYWDIVIEQWLQNDFNSPELREQFEYAQAMGISDQNRLPEPYWGDPENCSFAMMTYNPGSCCDSRHNYRFCQDSSYSMINEIKKSKYSDFAKSFPLLRDLKPTENWFSDSIGRAWWQHHKEKWIDGLLGAMGSKNLPFAIEICAWHSSYWKGINDKDFNRFNPLITDRVYNAFIEAIKNSKLKVGLAFGKRIGSKLLDRYVNIQNLKFINKGINYNLYSTGTHYIINFWDDKNHRNKYPKNANEIIDILKTIKTLKSHTNHQLPPIP